MPRFIQNQEAIAAIDLGSNALRAVIVRNKGSEIEVIKNFREPLRLGEDVFNGGTISDEKMMWTEMAFIKLFHAFTEHNVTQTRAMATSAMRDSTNGPLLSQKILETTGIDIEIISGKEEALLIYQAVKGQVALGKKTTLLMDIGGGSTELTVVKSGEILSVKSFDVGTVRLLRYQTQEELIAKINLQVEKMLQFIRLHLGSKKIDIFVGTGGNLRRIGKIRKKILGKPTSEMALYQEIRHMEESILSMSYVDRIRRLELDQNRADVILPAIMLVLRLMQELKMEKIHLPRVGLKEGIILSMLPTPPRKFIFKD